MKLNRMTSIQFVIDPILISNDQSELIIRVLQEEGVSFSVNSLELDDLTSTLFFIEKRNLKKINHFKNKIIVLGTTENAENSAAFCVNFNSYEEITHFVKKMFWSQRHLQILERVSECERLYESIKDNLEKMGFNFNVGSLQKVFESLLELEILFLQEDSVENWNAHFQNLVQNNKEIQNIFLLKSNDLASSSYPVNDNVLIFKISSEDYYLYLHFEKFDLKKDAEFVDFLLTICQRAIQNLDHKLVKNDGEIDFWKKIFSKIPYPMSIISSLGDLLIYNESFSKIGLLPKECLRYKDFDSAEISQSFYKIRRIDFPINLIQVSYFVFYTSEERKLQKSGENSSKNSSSIDDLGIISSSIAHELNNPLAGILAALSLLSLEDDWEEDALSDLEDMKSGAKRCKELVEIFLGFSKFSPTANSRISIKASLDQAINLLRFRMIESNLRIDVKYSATLEDFTHQINASIMSMILYLVLSELMTAFAHHRLLTLVQNGVLSGELLEFSNQIILKLENEFEYEDKIAQSKLIQHLLIFEKLEISFLKQEIRLIYRS